jgi:large-conductance mechanosensitive channel
MDNRRQNKHESQQEIPNGLAQGVENLKSTISHRPELQGWLLFSGGVVLLLYGFGLLSIVNYVIIALGIYLVLYGGYRAHFAHRAKEVFNWVSQQLGGKKH